MTPSHVKKKNGQRYRYYVSQAVLQRRPDEAGALRRVQAQAIEDLVRDRIRKLLSGSIASDSGAGGPANSDLHALITRVKAGSHRVEITLRKAAVATEFDVLQRRLGRTI